ncbi:hypothetical protein DPSP01_013133 [Paraphaeosphaeria sporulosa]|uniref:Uncharacterized protein n=1 Tax=Paraphaeosphaeria sporulosa TaxID=1460663 RepID=A0A177CDT3_9PLEO|nr:uncharacterized protein CC84DRAFT_1218293 [Paraphaeosphaeria sporulosa]OAG04880.1 hypothetical protein CC84DRAFT_1218293 [Paraphaeosphaeria sporulosa]
MRVTEATQLDENYVDEVDSQTAVNLGHQTRTQYPKLIEQCVPAIKTLGTRNLYLNHASHYFAPTFFDDMHSEPELKRFAGLHIEEWTDVEATAWLSCGPKLPSFPVDVHWFSARDKELLKHTHYHSSEIVSAESLPLGMKFIDPSYMWRCDKFISEILHGHTAVFRKRCFNNDKTGIFLGELFQLMKDVPVPHRLINDTLRLITVTYIMGRAITLDHVSGMSSIPRTKGFGAARLISHQIKHPFHVLQKTIVETTTLRLMQTIVSPKGCDDLLAAFICVIGLSMVTEEQQVTYLETNVKIMGRKASTVLADSGCEDTEWFVTMVMRMFFHHVGDPREKVISDPQRPALVEFVDAVCHLVEKNYALLVCRKKNPVSNISFRNLEENSLRLVGLFLLTAFKYDGKIDHIDDTGDDSTVAMAPIANLKECAWWKKKRFR